MPDLDRSYGLEPNAYHEANPTGARRAPSHQAEPTDAGPSRPNPTTPLKTCRFRLRRTLRDPGTVPC